MTRTWQENEDVLQQFREWLLETGREVEAIELRHNEARALFGEEQFLHEPRWDDEQMSGGEHDDFNQESESDAPVPADEAAPELPSVGLISLIEAFTSLRHETKLQTKSSRSLGDSVQSTLEGLDIAIRQFESVQSREEEAAARAAQPFAEALANLDEALARGAEAIIACRQQATGAVPEQLRDSLDKRFRQLPWWRRWLSRHWHRQAQAIYQEELSTAMNTKLNHVMEGYELIQNRLRRVMQEQGVERMACVGKPANPAQMTVVELVDDPAVEPETVLEEVRPGYTYNNKILRFAEVRAVRRLDDSSKQEARHSKERMKAWRQFLASIWGRVTALFR